MESSGVKLPINKDVPYGECKWCHKPLFIVGHFDDGNPKTSSDPNNSEGWICYTKKDGKKRGHRLQENKPSTPNPSSTTPRPITDIKTDEQRIADLEERVDLFQKRVNGEVDKLYNISSLTNYVAEISNTLKIQNELLANHNTQIKFIADKVAELVSKTIITNVTLEGLTTEFKEFKELKCQEK